MSKCASAHARGPARALAVNYTFLWIQDPCCAILLIDGIVSYLNKFVHHLLLRSHNKFDS